jgi:hypothetical protein
MTARAARSTEARRAASCRSLVSRSASSSIRLPRISAGPLTIVATAAGVCPARARSQKAHSAGESSSTKTSICPPQARPKGGLVGHAEAQQLRAAGAQGLQACFYHGALHAPAAHRAGDAVVQRERQLRPHWARRRPPRGDHGRHAHGPALAEPFSTCVDDVHRSTTKHLANSHQLC